MVISKIIQKPSNQQSGSVVGSMVFFCGGGAGSPYVSLYIIHLFAKHTPIGGLGNMLIQIPFMYILETSEMTTLHMKGETVY